MKVKKAEIETSIHFQAHDRHHDGEAIELILGFEQGNLVEVCLELRTNLETLRQIEYQGDFHNTPDVRLPAAIEGFVAERPIFIEMRLEPSLLAQLPSTPEAVAEQLASAATTLPALLDASSWYVLNVKQAHGPVMTGYATTWFVPA